MPKKSLAELHLAHKKEIASRVAKQHLRIQTLDSRGRDSLDFHEVSVASISDALMAAFDAGIAFNEGVRDDL